MELESLTQLLILTHACFGGLALLTGLIALLAKKGKSIHKKSGLAFFYSMLFSAITALIICCIPDHYSPFLFTIGLFSSYFILTGYRALRFKKKSQSVKIDKVISLIMCITGLIMILYPVILYNTLNIVLAVFGVLSILLSLRDFQLYNNQEELQSKWLKLHLGNMIGGYIGAVTAFVVINNLIPGIYGWFVPGIIGGLYITYWNIKLGD